MSTISARFADFAIGSLTIPDEVLSLAKHHFLDTLGVANASSGFGFVRPVLEGVQSLGSGAEAGVVGLGARLPAASAAIVNGVLAHGLDFDDTHIAAIYHASASAFATSLSVGEQVNASGREVLEAYIVALEVGCRVALAGKGEFHDRGFHPTAICAPFSSAAAAARLLGLQSDQLVNAMGICGSQAGGLLELDGSWLKRLHPGWASHSGISAALLARSGFIGPKTVFEGKHGYYAAHLGRIPTTEDLVAGLGEEWILLGLGIKPYPCCHFIHAFADAAIELRNEYPDDITVANIERIEAPLSRRLHHLVAEPIETKKRPQTEYDGLFSVPFVLGLALTKGEVMLSGFYEGGVFDPEVLEMAGKVDCTEDPQSDFPAHFPGEVKIYLKDGRCLNRRKSQSRGTPGLRVDQAEIVRKFEANSLRVLPADRVRRLRDAALGIEKVSSIRDLVALTIHAEVEAVQ